VHDVRIYTPLDNEQWLIRFAGPTVKGRPGENEQQKQAEWNPSNHNSMHCIQQARATGLDMVERPEGISHIPVD
jgi:hypothetical protein